MGEDGRQDQDHRAGAAKEGWPADAQARHGGAGLAGWAGLKDGCSHALFSDWYGRGGGRIALRAICHTRAHQSISYAATHDGSRRFPLRARSCPRLWGGRTAVGAIRQTRAHQTIAFGAGYDGHGMPPRRARPWVLAERRAQHLHSSCISYRAGDAFCAGVRTQQHENSSRLPLGVAVLRLELDIGQRGAQLMGDARHELALELVQRLEPFVGGLQPGSCVREPRRSAGLSDTAAPVQPYSPALWP